MMGARRPGPSLSLRNPTVSEATTPAAGKAMLLKMEAEACPAPLPETS